MKKEMFLSGLVAFVVSASVMGFFNWKLSPEDTVKIEHITSTPTSSAVFTLNEEKELIPLDFTRSAEHVMNAVVHIKSTQNIGGKVRQPLSNSQKRQQLPDPFRDFFGNPDNNSFQPFFRFESPNRRQSPNIRMGTGSGVIINEKGYIVTNNHVIDNADDLEVTLHDNRTFKAIVVGTDPTTDLALLQIKGSDFPTLPLVNSDEVKVGEWVLAVGNPMGLNSTVTAGIVSAKARNINILKEQFAVESFIQTDAAINPGNSGGALVNLDGGLLGINTAIASPTGSYSGYGFAVPSNIVNKVVEDLLQYGKVQRGILGISIRSVDGNLAKDKALSINNGVYVDSLFENSAAAKGGLASGDVIVEIEGKAIKTAPELQEMVARHRPGDEIEIVVNRKGNNKRFTVVLNDKNGGQELLEKGQAAVLNVLGADFENLEAKALQKLGLKGGVKVSKLYAGKLRKNTEMQEGFIITKVDGQSVKNIAELVELLENKKGGVMLEGVYENIPGEYYYAFGL